MVLSVCGKAITHQTPFVVNGVPAQIGDFPWHATLYVERRTAKGLEKEFQCGATIIQTNLVMTAAHCIYDETYRTTMDPNKLFVVTGNVFRDYDSPLHNPVSVRKASVRANLSSHSINCLTSTFIIVSGENRVQTLPVLRANWKLCLGHSVAGIERGFRTLQHTFASLFGRFRRQCTDPRARILGKGCWLWENGHWLV